MSNKVEELPRKSPLLTTDLIYVTDGVTDYSATFASVVALMNGSSLTINGHSISLGGTLTLTPSDISLGNVTNDAQTRASVMPNTAPTAGAIPVGNSGATAYVPKNISGDATLSSAGALTVTKTNGVAFGSFATGTDAANLTGTINNARLSSVPNSALANSSITINGTAVSLGGTRTITATDLSLGNVTNDAQTKAAIVPNTAPAAGRILIGNAGGTAYAPVAVSGDATLSSTGAVAVTKINGHITSDTSGNLSSVVSVRNTAGVAVSGTNTNDNATAGDKGEYLTSSVAVGSAIVLTTNVAKDVTTITLTPGDWDVSGNITFSGSSVTTLNQVVACLNTTADTLDLTTPGALNSVFANASLGSSFMNSMIGPFRVSISADTPYHLVGRAGWTGGNISQWGQLRARRVR